MKHLVGVFDNESDLIKAFEQVRSKGIPVADVYMPYPVHEILEGLGKKTRIPHAAFFYGLFGALALIGGMYYASVLSWPLNFGGKPTNAFPSFLVVTIVGTILVVTLLTLLTFSVRARIYPGKTAVTVHPRATDDKFVLVVVPGDMYGEAEVLMKENGAEEVYVSE